MGWEEKINKGSSYLIRLSFCQEVQRRGGGREIEKVQFAHEALLVWIRKQDGGTTKKGITVDFL